MLKFNKAKTIISKLKSTTGFTLIELLLVIAIVAIIFAFSAPYSFRFYNTQLINEAQSNILSVLSQARHNALLQKNDSAWGVKFDLLNDQYILFQGTSYDSRDDVYDEVYPLLNDIGFSGDWTDEIVFSQYTGLPTANGTTTLTYENMTRQILLDEDGYISRVVVEGGGGEVAVEIPTDGLISYWSFDGNANDDFGTNDGVVDGATLTTGIGGVADTAYYFDGSGANIDTLTTKVIPIPNDFSVSVWVNLDAFDNYPSIFTQGNTSWDPSSFGVFYSLEHGGFILGRSGVWGPYTSGTLNPGWNHLVVTRDNSQSDYYQIYLNGVLDVQGTMTLGEGDYILRFGDSVHNNNPLTGSLDEVRIYNRALSEEEVSTIYDAEKPDIVTSLRSGLVGYWPLDDTSGSTASDESGNNNDGTLNGGVLVNQTGKVGQAMSFDGGDDEILLDTFSLPVTTTVTFNAWVKPTALNSEWVSNIISERIDYWNAVGFLVGGDLQGANASKINLYIYNGGTFYGNLDFSTSIVPVNTNDWTMATFVMSGTTWKLYFNGVLENEYTHDQAMLSGGTWRIGNDQIDYNSQFTGNIDEVGIWNRALSDDEISDLYNGGSGRSLVQ